MRSVLLSVVAGLLVSACGARNGSPGSPAAPSPTPSQPTLRDVAVVGPHVVPAGSVASYIATGRLSTGNIIQPLRPVNWSTDNAEVATITSGLDGYGDLIGLHKGTVTITASYQGASGTLSLEVRDVVERAGAAHLRIAYAP